MEEMNYETIYQHDQHIINQYHPYQQLNSIQSCISHLHNWLFHSPGPRHLHLQGQSHGLLPLHAAAAGANGAAEANLIHFHSFCTWEPWLVEP
jgi:hypothetical protein